MIVKICGITTLDDALAAIDFGADMLGFNFYPGSKRFISLENSALIRKGIARSGRQTMVVGVFVNAAAEDIEAAFEACPLDYAQLSGDEAPQAVRALKMPWIKAVRPTDPQSALEAGRRYSANWPANEKPAAGGAFPDLLVDAYHPAEYGGTGRTGDWDAARLLAEKLPIFLAGGLNAGNVDAAIEQVRPAAVDVASGVESRPGIKHRQKMEQFIRSAKSARI